MKTSMTTISAKQWNFVTQENLTAREAVLFLKSGLRVRTFCDNLREICGTDELEKQLIEGLIKIYEIENLSKVQPDSVRKKVHNWMTGKNIPTDREEVFRICFALNLNLEQSDKMLSRLTEQGIHYRNKKEIIFAYCLKYEFDYENAVCMAGQLSAKDNGNDEKDTYKEPMTQIMKLEFQKVKGKEDLFSFIMNHQSQMGNCHNTAYSYFCKMFSLLSGDEIEGEDIYSIEKVAEDYLRFNVPLDKKTAGYSNVQKIVKKYWTGASGMKAMKSRSMDVNRKTLLLLYIVTGGVWEKEYTETDETYIGLEDFLEAHCNRMNQMLSECGMSSIDPRNIFDYLILYCLRPEEKIFMSDRMESLLGEIFEN